jgi:nucleotide-binding universal stress UspA family protein
MTKKILVAIDYSENALRAVRFAAETLAPENKITLFSVIPSTAAVCDLNSPELTPYFQSQKEAFCGLEDEKNRLVKDTIRKARAMLVQAGFAEENISVKVEPQKRGVARDIANEARAGYDMVVMGKRGLSGVKEFFMGSVSQKVIQLAGDLSVTVVG